MKQLIQDMKSGETRVIDVPVPQPADNAALIQTAASLVSVGTERMLVEFAKQSLVGKARSRPDLVRQVLDKARKEGLVNTLQAATNRLDQPMALGYSSAGTIIAVGSALKDFKVGDRVACGGGGYAVHAEYATVPQNLLVKLPDNVDFNAGAFATIGAIAMQGFRLSESGLGEKVAVIGLGLLGLLSAMITKAAGCFVIGIDIDPQRVELAQKMGIEAVAREDAENTASTFSKGNGVDAVLICADTASDDPVILAGNIARDKAKVVAVGAVGLNVPRKVYYEKELSLVVSRSYGPGRYDPIYEEKGQDYPIAYVRWTEGRNMQAFVDLLSHQNIDVTPLISHQFPIKQADKAYKLITASKKESFLGVLLTYPQTDEAPTQRVANLAAPAISVTPGALLAVGVLGAGNYARATFLPVVKKVGGVAPIGIVSASGLSAQHAAKKFGFGYSASDPQTVFEDPAINIVAILTRHNLHTAQILQSFEAGKHVFCEKPLAINQDELHDLAAVLAEDNKPLLMAGFNRRFAPLAKQMKSAFSSRTEPLIAHYRVNAGYLPPEHWTQDPEIGGGRIIGEACHFIDFLTFLVGENPTAVQAYAMEDQGKYSQDNVVMQFSYPDGSIGTVTYLANGDRSFSKERVEAFCGGRIAVLEDFRTLETIYKGKLKRSTTAQDKGHQAAWQAFLNALRASGQPPIPYDQLLGTTRASFAVLESLRCGKPINI